MDRRESQALDRYITGNYGEDSVAAGREGVLSDECEAMLGARDMYSEAAFNQPGVACIRDAEDGAHLFTVSQDISTMNLLAVLNYGSSQRRAGVEQGRYALQHQLRALLDVPAKDGAIPT